MTSPAAVPTVSRFRLVWKHFLWAPLFSFALAISMALLSVHDLSKEFRLVFAFGALLFVAVGLVALRPLGRNALSMRLAAARGHAEWAEVIPRLNPPEQPLRKPRRDGCIGELSRAARAVPRGSIEIPRPLQVSPSAS